MPVVLDRPPVIVDPPTDAAPPTAPRLRRQWWRFRFPWVKTAIGAPTSDDELLIDNATDDAWSLYLGYRDLGTVEPRDQRLVQVVKTGLFSARQSVAPAGTAYITIPIRPAVHTVRIRQERVDNNTLYDLQLI